MLIQEFPKWKYHAEKEAVIVADKDAEIALGDGWFNNPAEVVPSDDSSEVVQKIEEIIHQPKKARKAKA